MSKAVVWVCVCLCAHPHARSRDLRLLYFSDAYFRLLQSVWYTHTHTRWAVIGSTQVAPWPLAVWETNKALSGRVTNQKSALQKVSKLDAESFSNATSGTEPQQSIWFPIYCRLFYGFMGHFSLPAWSLWVFYRVCKKVWVVSIFRGNYLHTQNSMRVRNAKCAWGWTKQNLLTARALMVQLRNCQADIKMAPPLT